LIILIGGVSKMTKYAEDDYCDIYKKKICDNCGKCLEMDGVDIKAIKIEDIAKTVEENKVLEEEYKKDLESEEELENELDEEDDSSFDDYDKLKDAYKDFAKENNLGEEYEDAFDHIDYSNEESLFDDGNLEEMTEEVFPGLRILKKKTE
jgi:membrane-associated HD superfamily phosphohydrolase